MEFCIRKESSSLSLLKKSPSITFERRIENIRLRLVLTSIQSLSISIQFVLPYQT